MFIRNLIARGAAIAAGAALGGKLFGTVDAPWSAVITVMASAVALSFVMFWINEAKAGGAR